MLQNLPLVMAYRSNDMSADKAQKSVFVGNISYDTSEAELRDLFSQVGPIVNFRYVLDRETGKPKGYGFCEFSDPSTAESAVRNLNGTELKGRPLRVDSAVNSAERQRDRLEKDDEIRRQNAINQAIAQEESAHGPAVEPSKAPEAISRAVASLPPEQMFELMKQIKMCIASNPVEARHMLLSNPQLAYALLQAQVVMRILDPQLAMSMLHKDHSSQHLRKPIGTDGGPQVHQPPQPGVVPTTAGPVMGAAPPVASSAAAFSPGAPLTQMQAASESSATPHAVASANALAANASLGMGMGPMDSLLSSAMSSGLGAATAAGPSTAAAAPPGVSAEDAEKAQLIMQVLQLTDEQIDLLPADQKHSVLVLREQLRTAQL